MRSPFLPPCHSTSPYALPPDLIGETTPSHPTPAPSSNPIPPFPAPRSDLFPQQSGTDCGPVLAPYLSGHVPGALTAPSPLRGPSRRGVGAADSGSRWAGGDETGGRALSAVLMRTPRTREPVGGWAGGRLGPGEDHCAVRGADKGAGPERRGRTRGSSGPDR